MTEAFSALFDKVESWGQSFVLMVPNLVAALLALLVSIAVGRLAGNIVHRGLERMSSNHALNSFARKLVRFVGIAVGLVVALQILELEKAATTFLAGAGLIGIALGFAFQDLSANFISGVVMAIKRPIRVGDLVETNEVIGLVERIELRSTVMRTLDGKLVNMPNRKIFEEAIINHSSCGARRVDVEVGVAYDSDLEEVDAAVREAIDAVESRDSSQDVEVFFSAFGGSSIDLVARFWIPFQRGADIIAARDQAIRAIKSSFDRRDIVIPFPIRTLDVSGDAVAALADRLAG